MMLECRWLKNLSNFATNRPPFVIFTLCLAIFAAGLFSIGYYVQSQGFDQNHDWKAFTSHISNKKFCMFSNNTGVNLNATNGTSLTSSSLDYALVYLPVILQFSPSKLYTGDLQNISHVTTLVEGSELGFEGSLSEYQVNLTFLLNKPWSISCRSSMCSGTAFSACVAARLPVEMIPKNLPHGSCNSTEVVNMVSMSSFTQCTSQHCCYEGVVAKASLPKYYKGNPAEGPSEMGLNDWATVNLRLQYSSYFLFVLAITCILYGMIKGRSMKSTSKKGSHGQTI